MKQLINEMYVEEAFPEHGRHIGGGMETKHVLW